MTKKKTGDGWINRVVRFPIDLREAIVQGAIEADVSYHGIVLAALKSYAIARGFELQGWEHPERNSRPRIRDIRSVRVGVRFRRSWIDSEFPRLFSGDIQTIPDVIRAAVRDLCDVAGKAGWVNVIDFGDES